ncbi:MAG: hypothetical protein M1826_003702 [Phylliscum demangeonii]|nr:MAG: hypothetical protein M1826_003702 [Phylliscum demangeonii]
MLSDADVDDDDDDDGDAAGHASGRVKKQLMANPRAAQAMKDDLHARTPSPSEDDGLFFPSPTAKNPGARPPSRPLFDLPTTTHASSAEEAPAPSAHRHASESDSDSDSDLPDRPQTDARFVARVEQERRERQAQAAQADAASKRKATAARLEALARAKDGASSSADDGSEGDQAADETRLTPQARPTRKASKKALEEMKRETQRMSRSMQLTHEPRTRKKITTQSLLDRFNYRPAGSDPERDRSGVGPRSSSPVASEVEAPQSTPPTSPPSSQQASRHPKSGLIDHGSELESGPGMADHDADLDLPALDQMMAESNVEKGRRGDISTGKAGDGLKRSQRTMQRPKQPVRKIRIQVPLPRNGHPDSDSELEVMPISKAKAALLAHSNQPQDAQSHPLQVQRAFAQLNGQPHMPKGSTTQMALEVDLQRRARQQAAKERESRVEELRKRGVYVQTAEERRKEIASIEDMIDDAREETVQIAKREKAAAKKAAGAGSQPEGFIDDSEDEDDEWSDDDGNVTLSGSEDEEVEEDDVEDDKSGEPEAEAEADEENAEVKQSALPVLDDHGTHQSESHHTSDTQGHPPNGEFELMQPCRATSSNNVEDSGDEISNPFRPKFSPLQGKTVSHDVSLGLTQMFAATMADGESHDVKETTAGHVQEDRHDDNLDFLRQVPTLTMPTLRLPEHHDPRNMIGDSQALHGPISLGQVELSQADPTDSAGRAQDYSFTDSLWTSDPSATQLSAFPDPTQDAGFAHSGFLMTHPVEGTAAAEDSVVLEAASSKASAGVLHHVQADGGDEPIAGGEGDVEKSGSAFHVMRAAAKKAQKRAARYSKKRSQARGMVVEQAEESDDEYAGLGGASHDDESGEEEDEELAKALLDDETPDVDEDELAALRVERARQDDKQQIERIYRDIAHGGFRKRRGADLDLMLSDDDYDEEARRRLKRRKEMKARKALMADEHVEKIADNPKKSAFFHSIEDRDPADDVNFLDDEDPVDDGRSTPQQQQQQPAPPDGGPEADDRAAPSGAYHKRTRGVDDVDDDNDDNDDDNDPATHGPARVQHRPLPAPARKAPKKKRKRATTTTEVRECLSEMLAAPNAPHRGHDGQESDEIGADEHPYANPKLARAYHVNNNTDDDDDNHNPPPHRSTSAGLRVIDRLSLQRAHTTDHHHAAWSNPALHPTTTTTRLAFHHPSAPAAAASASASFWRVPALLRRATTSAAAAAGSVVSAPVVVNNSINGGGGIGGGVGGGGGGGGGASNKKNSSINWSARPQERVQAVQQRARERKRDRKRRRVGRESAAAMAGLVSRASFDA